MRSILVTGGAGFIGGNFIHYWCGRYPTDHIVVLDALTYAGNVATLSSLSGKDGLEFVRGDITDVALVDALFAKHQFSVVVHFAAESHVDRSIVDPGAFVRTNVLGTQVLLQVARSHWSSSEGWKAGARFHHVSTDEVYGSLGLEDAAFHELTPYRPNSPYSASKAGSDHLVRAYHHTYGMPISISNCSNNYGPYQFPEKFIPLLIVNALTGRKLPVYGDGRQIRDWLFVDDHCRAIDMILSSTGRGETYNVGGRAERENITIVHEVCSLIDRRFARDADLQASFPDCPASHGKQTQSLIEHVRDRPGHDRRYAINPEKIAGELGFEPSETLSSGLAKTVDWYMANRDWWQSVMDGRYRNWIDLQYGT
jgi:dTDP-glucose 4,6-dehydratase